jgi:hypothetical protein
LLKAVTAATAVNQLLFQRPIVKMDLSGQQHIQIFKRDRAIMVNMQFAQGVKRYIRVPVQPRRENRRLKMDSSMPPAIGVRHL